MSRAVAEAEWQAIITDHPGNQWTPNVPEDFQFDPVTDTSPLARHEIPVPVVERSSRDWLKGISRGIRRRLTSYKKHTYEETCVSPGFDSYTPEQLRIMFPDRLQQPTENTAGNMTTKEPFEPFVWPEAVSSQQSPIEQTPRPALALIEPPLEEKPGFRRFFERAGELTRTKTARVVAIGALATAAFGASFFLVDQSNTQPENTPAATAIGNPFDSATEIMTTETSLPQPAPTPVIQQEQQESIATTEASVSNVVLQPGETVWDLIEQKVEQSGISGSAVVQQTACILAAMRAENPGVDMDRVRVGEQPFQLADSAACETAAT